VFAQRVGAWLAEDVDAYLGCWHDDLSITVPSRDAPIVGVGAYRELVEQSFAWARPLSFEVHHLAIDGDLVLAEWTIRVARRSDEVVHEWSGMSVCEVRDGRITWWREYHRAPPAPVPASAS
jgi:limonene-1,2-epoxide hydrolase